MRREGVGAYRTETRRQIPDCAYARWAVSSSTDIADRARKIASGFGCNGKRRPQPVPIPLVTP
eukprot:3940236-Rhodomonas_salina.6